MACKLNYEKYMADMKGKGYSAAEALNLLPPENVAADMKEANDSVVVAALASDNSNVRNQAAAEIATWDQNKILGTKDENGNTLNKNPNVADAYDNAHGGKGTTKIEALEGTFNAKNANNGQYLATRISNGDENALKYVQDIATGKDANQKVALVDSLLAGGMTTYQIQNISGAGTKLGADYKKHYDDIRNVDRTYLEVTNAGSGASVEYRDQMGNTHKWQVVQGGALLVPVGKNADGSVKYEYVEDAGFMQIKPNDPYNSATWAIKLDDYIDKVLRADDPIAALDAFDKDVQKDPSKWYTCTGTGCPGMTPPDEAASGGGGGGDGGNGSGGTEPESISLYVDCNITDARVYANGIDIGQVNTKLGINAGEYLIEVKRTGYKTYTKLIQITKYPVSLTITLTKVGGGIGEYITNAGGLAAITPAHLFYLYCTFKIRTTTIALWGEMASATGITTPVPAGLTANDVMYLWYMVNGDPNSAKALVDSGEVIIG